MSINFHPELFKKQIVILNNKHKIHENAPFHAHHGYEILYIVNGSGECHFKNKILKIKKKDIIYILPDEKHTLKDNKDDLLHVYSIFYKIKDFPELTRENNLLANFIILQEILTTFFDFNFFNMIK